MPFGIALTVADLTVPPTLCFQGSMARRTRGRPRIETPFRNPPGETYSAIERPKERGRLMRSEVRHGSRAGRAEDADGADRSVPFREALLTP
jgi:hypothetical protein